MRFIAALLILANLLLFLMVHRLPAVDSTTTPEINLPRVTRIEMLESARSASEAQQRDSRCFVISGFLAPVGARNWLLLNDLPIHEHRIIRQGLAPRTVLSLQDSSVDRPPLDLSQTASPLAPFSFVTRRGEQLSREMLFSDSGYLAASLGHAAENKRGLTVDSIPVSFYSYALVGAEGLRKVWSQRFDGGYSGNLRPESCQSVAKPRQNP